MILGVFVYVPNKPFGSKSDNIEVSDFLNRPGNAPEKQALLRLIGTLVNRRSDLDPMFALTTTTIRTRPSPFDVNGVA